MKICFLSYEYPKETDFGEIGRYTYYASKALRDLGHEYGEELPKGAGVPVDRAARRIFEAGGIEALGRIAKAEGLFWGGDWRSFKDWAHVQAHPNSKLTEIKRQSGVAWDPEVRQVDLFRACADPVLSCVV